MSKSIITIIFFLIFLISLYLFLSNRLPPGVEPKGNETTVVLIALWTAIISLLGTILAFILRIIEIISNKKK